MAFHAARNFGGTVSQPEPAETRRRPKLKMKVLSSDMSREMEESTLNLLEEAYYAESTARFKESMVNEFGNTWHVVSAKLPHLAAAIDPAAEQQLSVTVEKSQYILWKHHGREIGILPKWDDLDVRHIAVL